MSLKTLLPNKDYILLDNEVSLLSNEEIKNGYWVIAEYPDKKYLVQVTEIHLGNVEHGKQLMFSGGGFTHEIRFCKKITHSTASLQGVKQLDRSLFVKGVDVEELARENCPKDYVNPSYEDCFKYGFERGYNANKNEFTRGDLENAISIGRIISKGGKPRFDYYEIVSKLRPLSLPSSIIIEGEEITIKW